MRCRECGYEVENDKAFCPVCGAPMKITADYDYIQTEIANKVDRFFSEFENEDAAAEAVPEDSVQPDPSVTAEKKSDKPAKDRTGEARPRTKPDRKHKNRRNETFYDDIDEKAKTKPISKTKPVYGPDSVFDELPEEDLYEEDRPVRPQRPIPPERRRRGAYIEYPPIRNQTAAKVFTVLVIFLIIAGAAIGVMAISGMFSSSERELNVNGARSSLTCNVTAGETYAAPVEIVINKSVEGNIFYTLDGSEPSIDSKMYTGPFQITASDVALSYPDVTLRAISFSQNSEKSGDININFHLEYDEGVAASLIQETTTEPPTQVITADPPLISPSSGSYTTDTDILVSAQSGATIYYTYDGTIPDTRSSLYTGPVKMKPGNSTFSAICVVDGVQSDYTTANYTLEYGYATSSGQAMSSVIDNLLWNGYIIDYDCNTNDGYAALSHKGVYEIGGYTYYVIQVDFYNSDGVIADTAYRGVGVNYGNVYYLAPDGDSFYLY